ncbi:MAG: hypothetical protein ACKVQB_07575 [Bacteroidia bacterium]
MSKYIGLFVVAGIIIFGACKDTYTGPYPAEPTCVEYPANDTVELINGTIKLEDTTYYIANYVDESSTTKIYPCTVAAAYQKNGFPIQYSGYHRKKEGSTKQYIQITAIQPILNETIITNYIGFVRNRDSATININERTGVIKNSKIENAKLKLLITYNGCSKGRKYYLSLYKTTQILGEKKSYGFLTSPYEACPAEHSMWYEIDVSSYKKSTLAIYDGVKTHLFEIPE